MVTLGIEIVMYLLSPVIFFRPILAEIRRFRQSLVPPPRIKFYKIPSCGDRDIRFGRPDGRLVEKHEMGGACRLYG